MLLLGGIFLLLVGLIMLIKPDLFFLLTEAWKTYSSADPSDFYIFTTRLGGAIFTLVGVAAVTIFFVT